MGDDGTQGTQATGVTQATETRSSGPRARAPPSVSFRRQSTSERINEILEGGRDRADTMGQDPAQLNRRPSSQAALGDTEQDDAPDEMTGIASRGSGHNYQALRVTNTNRSRRSIYSRQTSRAASGTEEPASNDGSDAENTANKSWLRKRLGMFQSIELENKGSVARDHLALERTFLAWLRTSLAFASIGVAITQLFRLNTTLSDSNDSGSKRNDTLRALGKPLGSVFLGISILTLLLGFRRYFQGQEWVIKGKFPASRGTIIIMSFVALALMLASLVVVVVMHDPDAG